MLAVSWADLAAGGAFLVGVGVGALITIRLAKVITAFLVDVSRRESRRDDGVVSTAPSEDDEGA